MKNGLKRSPSLVLYWENDSLICEDYLSKKRAVVAPKTIELLQSTGSGNPSPSARRALRSLAGLGFLRRKLNKTQVEFGRWKWGAAARHFFFSTQNAHLNPVSKSERMRYARRIIAPDPMPPVLKSYPQAAQIVLPKLAKLAPDSRVAMKIINTRHFAKKPLALEQLNELLYVACGKRSIIDGGIFGKLLVKGYYSAGYRHPLEVYPVVFNVRGLKPGVYHYNVDKHALEFLRPGRFYNQVWESACRQNWMKNCAAVLMVTSVFERTSWKYRHDFGLRAIFGEFGHLSQAFYQAAAGLGLGACTTYSVRHALAERLLDVDGVNEAFISLVVIGRKSQGLRQTDR
ncbi:MAG: SagB/ThcOx family dehydrogenase [Elusimicrobia bacterium]|nr:SagB/ThcOx family dehydrogenase [Elusimicrobiota bacterium]